MILEFQDAHEKEKDDSVKKGEIPTALKARNYRNERDWIIHREK